MATPSIDTNQQTRGVHSPRPATPPIIKCIQKQGYKLCTLHTHTGNRIYNINKTHSPCLRTGITAPPPNVILETYYI